MCELTAALMMGVSVTQTVLGAAQQAQQAQLEAAQQRHRAWQASYQTAYQVAQARNAAAVSEYNAQDAERPRARRAPKGACGRGGAAAAQDIAAAGLPAGAPGGRIWMLGGSDLEGSPFDILGDAAALGEQDALATRYQAAREAWAQRIQAANKNAETDFLATSMSPWTGSADPGFGIARSLLGGASDLFGIAEKRGLLPGPTRGRKINNPTA